MSAERYRLTLKRLSRIALAGLLGIVAIPTDGQADFSDGEQAYSLRQFVRAIDEFRPLLEQGHRGAEMMTGLMYLQGDGYPRDPAKAAVWLYKAATKGDHSAQLVLGSQRLYGLGIGRDLVDAFMWLTLAGQSESAGVVQQALIFRDSAEAAMTTKEIESATKRAEQFRPWRDGFIDDD
ncbi:MAG: sel1 repeat family protein [Alphaproteobacteria bacterium]|nr:sel1 repeat family protein [Alphaproteobacteria bacterium]